MVMCPSVCLSVTSRCSIKTAEENGLNFGTAATPAYPTLCYTGIRVFSKIRVLRLARFSELFGFYF